MIWTAVTVDITLPKSRRDTGSQHGIIIDIGAVGWRRYIILPISLPLCYYRFMEDPGVGVQAHSRNFIVHVPEKVL